MRQQMGTNHDTYVRARIDLDTKSRASDALQAMGLSVSDAIRLLMIRIADEQRMPFEIRIPNKETLEAIEELESGKRRQLKTIEEFMDGLNEKD